MRGKLDAIAPGALIAGTNCVATLAEEHGVGTRDLKRVEVVGVPVREALFNFAALPPKNG